MPFKIGSKYEQTKARLKRRILDKTAEITNADNTIFEQYGAQCYFCQKHIKGRVLLILEEHFKGCSIFPIDESCLIEARFNLHYN